MGRNVRDIRIDVLGLGSLVKSIGYLLFPVGGGVELFSRVIEAASGLEAQRLREKERPEHKGKTAG